MAQAHVHTSTHNDTIRTTTQAHALARTFLVVIDIRKNSVQVKFMQKVRSDSGLSDNSLNVTDLLKALEKRKK